MAHCLSSIEEERQALREEIEEAKGVSRTVSMLDSRVSSMLSKLKDEIQDTEMTIGEALHSLDLDRDGMLSHAELVEAMDSLHLSKRPDAAAFRELLEQIDVDQDGQVSRILCISSSRGLLSVACAAWAAWGASPAIKSRWTCINWSTHSLA